MVVLVKKMVVGSDFVIFGGEVDTFVGTVHYVVDCCMVGEVGYDMVGMVVCGDYMMNCIVVGCVGCKWDKEVVHWKCFGMVCCG